MSRGDLFGPALFPRERLLFSKRREQLRNRFQHSPWIWSWPGWLSKQPISLGVAAFHGLQEERAVVVLAGRGVNALKLSLPGRA